MQRKITLLRDSLTHELLCERHVDQPIIFVCISHQNCPQSNLFCVSCVDEMAKVHEHHLISLRKFEQFNSLLSEKAQGNLEEIKQVHISIFQALHTLRTKLTHIIDMVIASQVGILEDTFTTENQTTREHLIRQKITKVASQPIWSKIQSHRITQPQIQREISVQIQSNNQNIINFVNSVLNAFDHHANPSPNPYQKIQFPLDQGSQNSHIDEGQEEEEKVEKVQKRLPRRYYLQRDKKKKKIKINRQNKAFSSGKKFSEEQKLRIVNKISKTMPKSKLAKIYNIAYSTIRKWQLNLISEQRIDGTLKTHKKRTQPKMQSSEELKEQDI